MGRGTAVLLMTGSGAEVGLLSVPFVELPPPAELPPLETVLLPLLVWLTADDESAFDPDTVWLPPLWLWLLLAEADTDAEAEGCADSEGEAPPDAETEDIVMRACE